MNTPAELMSPGSYNDYLDKTQQTHGKEAIEGYGEELYQYRLGKAALLRY